MGILDWVSNRTGTSFGHGKARGLPVSNLPPCHWSSQLFDLRAPWSTDVPVLLLNQPNVSMSDFQPESHLSTSWENSQHFETPPMINPRNDVWETSVKIPYYWSRWCFWLDETNFKPISTTQFPVTSFYDQHIPSQIAPLNSQNFSRVLKPQAETRVLLLSMSRSLSQ